MSMENLMAARLIGEDFKELNDDVIDAICEIGNMIAGGTKELLRDTDYAFDTIGLPALIFGANYNVYHLKNITSVSVTFEITEIPIVQLGDKFFTTTIVMMEQSSRRDSTVGLAPRSARLYNGSAARRRRRRARQHETTTVGPLCGLRADRLRP